MLIINLIKSPLLNDSRIQLKELNGSLIHRAFINLGYSPPPNIVD